MNVLAITFDIKKQKICRLMFQEGSFVKQFYAINFSSCVIS